MKLKSIKLPPQCRLCEIIRWSMSFWPTAPATQLILTHCHLSVDHDTTFLFQLAELWFFCFLFVLFCLFILFFFFFSFNCISFLVRNLSDQYTKGYKSRNITSIAFVFSFLFNHVLQYNIPLPSCLCRFTQKNLPLLCNNYFLHTFF